MKPIIKKTIIVSIIIISSLFASYYVYNIQHFGSFRIELYDNDKNISEDFELFGQSFFNRKAPLTLTNNGWENTNNWYFKKLIIKSTNPSNNGHISISYTKKGKTITKQFKVRPDTLTEIIIKNERYILKMFYFFKKNFFQENKFINALFVFTFLIFLIFPFYQSKKTTLQKPKISDTTIFQFSAIVYILFVANVIYLSFYLFPSAEDFEITYDLSSNPNPILHYYNTLDARYFTNFLTIYFNPLYYQLPIWTYNVIPSVIIFIFSISTFRLTKRISLNKKKSLSLALLFTVIYFSVLSIPSSSLFFMGAAYHYTVFSIILIHIIVECCDYFKSNRPFILYKILLLIILLHGSNEFSLMLTPIIVLTIAIHNYSKTNRLSTHTIILLVVFVISAAIVVFAPGNQNRMHSQGLDFFYSIDLSEKIIVIAKKIILDMFHFIKATIIQKPFLLFLIFPTLVISSLFPIPELKNISAKKLAFIFTFSLAFILFAFPLPFYLSGIWTTNNMSPNNYNHTNIQSFLLLILFLFSTLTIAQKQGKSKLLQTIQNNSRSKMFLLLFSLSFIFSKNLFTDTVNDTFGNTLSNYHNEVTLRHENLYKKNQLKYITFKELKHKPITILSGNDYYLGNSIIGARIFENHFFRTFIGVNQDGDTTFIKDFYSENLAKFEKISNINEKLKISKKFGNTEKTHLLKKVLLFDNQKNIIETIIAGYYLTEDSIKSKLTVEILNNSQSLIKYDTIVSINSNPFLLKINKNINFNDRNGKQLILDAKNGNLRQKVDFEILQKAF